MNRFGDDVYTGWDGNDPATYATSNSTVNEVDPNTGTVSNVPYYLANSTPSPGNSDNWGPPATNVSGGSSGMVDINGQPVSQPGAPAAAAPGSFDWGGLLKGIAAGLTGNTAGTPKVQPPAAAAPSMVPWIIGGAALLGVVALLVVKSGKKRSMAGYKKRRRSRR